MSAVRTWRPQQGGIGNPAVLVLIILCALVMVTPLLWTLGLSIKNNAELMRSTDAVFHAPYTLENYASILDKSSVFRWLLNSVVVSTCMTAGVLILSSLAGYGFARLEFRGAA